ncbi:kinetochore protein nuf2 [Biomphalaria glabrata]|nr:putative kinetochore protein nuf2 [Biomphalaria glabrata]
MTDFECPILPISEICLFFRDCKIDISEKDFKSPDPRKWHAIYGEMFEIQVKRSIDQVVQQMLMVSVVDKSYHEYKEEGCALMAYTLCLARVFNVLGFKDFSLRDLVSPNSDRIQKLSSLFINMVRHTQIRRPLIENIIQRVQVNVGQSVSARNRNKELKEEYEKAKEEQPVLEAEIKEKSEELEQEKLPIIELTRESEEEKRISESLKLRHAELKLEKERFKQDVLQIQQNLEALSCKVVKSPQRFRKELERLKERVSELKEELRTKERQSSENRQLLETTIQKHSALQKAVKLSTEVTQDMEKENELDHQIKQLSEYITEQQEVFKKSMTKQEDLMERLAIRKEARNKVQHQVDGYKKSTYQQLMDLKQHLSKLESNFKVYKSEISQLHSQMEAKKNCIQELEASKEEERNNFQRKCNAKTEEINNYNENLVKVFEQFQALMN